MKESCNNMCTIAIRASDIVLFPIKGEAKRNDPNPHRVRSVSTINSETKWTESPLKLDNAHD